MACGGKRVPKGYFLVGCVHVKKAYPSVCVNVKRKAGPKSLLVHLLYSHEEEACPQILLSKGYLTIFPRNICRGCLSLYV